MKNWVRVVVGAAMALVVTRGVAGQGAGVWSNWELVARTPSVTGHEEALAKRLKEHLIRAGYARRTDNLGNVIVTVGSGAPHRLLVTPMDQPGYVVSGITADGFLRMQRLPQAAPSAVFDSLHFAQPAVVMTRGGKMVRGVFGGLSVHLEPGRLNTPKMNHLEEMYVDIGAKSAEEVRDAGVDVLDSISLDCLDYALGDQTFAGPGIGDHAGVVVLAEVLERIDSAKAKVRGTLTVAFVTQQWTGGRGLERVLNELQPEELIYVGRLQTKGSQTKAATEGKMSLPGEGVLVGVADAAATPGDLFVELNNLAQSQNIPLRLELAAEPRINGYTAAPPLPKRFVQFGVRTLYPTMPAETISYKDVSALETLLFSYVVGPTNTGWSGGGGASGCFDCGPPLLGRLTETYGASGHEGAVREKVKELLPEWARKKAETDAAGNLVLHLGEEKKQVPRANTALGMTNSEASQRAPKIAFVAHMDEIGYEVKKIEEDGRLNVDSVGGGYPQYFLGHVVLVHKADGNTIGGVLELPDGWDKPGFEWPLSLRGMDEGQHVYVGTKSKEETVKLGIKAGDFVTIPKAYRPLLGTRANARSFDDRVGCAALIEAVRAIGPEMPGRDVTFVWSTEEEVGLKGAAAFAEQAAKDGRVPDFVFAIDTFVSSDSPLEVKRYGDAESGKGFVIRAVDNSNIVPLEYVDRVVKLARENKIPVQYGVTGGGNDGSVFTRFGSVDVALGWPLRYSHSPAEVIDTKDLDALSKIVAVIAKEW